MVWAGAFETAPVFEIKLLAPAIDSGGQSPCPKTAFNCCFQALNLSEACIKQLDGRYGEQLSAGIFAFLAEPQMHV
jgi:hypothetical protein